MKNTNSQKMRARKKKNSALARRLDRHFLACSVAGVAALGATSADAAIVYHSLTGANVPQNNTEFLFIDVDAGTFLVATTAPLGYDLNFFYRTASSGLLRFQTQTPNGALGFTSAPYGYIDKLASGITVDGAAITFLDTGILAAAQPPATLAEWNGGVTGGFVGFRFKPGATTFYGWARLNVTSGFAATVVDFAYENTGAAITTAAVPEPSTLALGCLAAGAAGLTLWRRKRE